MAEEVGIHRLKGLREYQGHTFSVWYKNEYHLSWLDDKPFVTSPDSMIIVQRDTGEPAISYDFSVGDTVAVIGRKAEELLVNVHIADSNRQAVGYGHTDFRAMMKALKDIGYERALALEPLPPVPDPYIAARLSRYRHLRDVYAEESIVRLRRYEEEV